VLHRSLGAADKVAGKAVLPAEEIQAFRNGLFDARQDILQLMERYRGLT
jgi:phage-related tail protein